MAASGGDGTIYYGTYDKKILVIDEATLTVRDSMTVASGIPIGLTLSTDRTKLYTIDPSFQTIEIFDVASRKSTARIRLSQGRTEVRMRGFNIQHQQSAPVVTLGIRQCPHQRRCGAMGLQLHGVPLVVQATR